MITRYIYFHHWFIKESESYLGWDSYYKARYKFRYPFIYAYVKFMFYSRKQILGIGR